jgi:hypothetical protein
MASSSIAERLPRIEGTPAERSGFLEPSFKSATGQTLDPEKAPARRNRHLDATS